jgi:hypothetical protein
LGGIGPPQRDTGTGRGCCRLPSVPLAAGAALPVKWLVVGSALGWLVAFAGR